MIDFANKLFEKAGVEVKFSKDNYDDIFVICKAISEHEESINSINTKDSEELSKIAEKVFADTAVENVWKIALLSKTFEDEGIYDISTPEVNDILEQCEARVAKWEDAISLLSKGMDSRDITDDAPDEKIDKASDFAIGCFFLAIEAAAYTGQDNFDLDAAEEGVKAWVTGYGNSFEYDEPVGGIIDEIDNYNLKDEIMEKFINFIGLYYGALVDDFENDDETTNWEQVSEQVGSAIL
jgi:hypothetical protein